MQLKKSFLRFLLLTLLAMFAVGSTSLMADSDDEHGGSDDNGGGGSSRDRDALSSTFMAIPPTKGKGDGLYVDLEGGDIETMLNSDVRLALELLDDDGNTLKVLNTHLGITVDNYDEAVITLFIGTDEDGDGTCLSEGPTSICVLETGGSDDLEVNEDNVLHAAWAMALRDDDGHLIGSGTCWTDFESTEVVPQFDDDGNMTSVVFNIEGGVQGMPEIEEGDGTMVGFSAPWLGFDDIDCSIDYNGNSTCEIIPVMMGLWID